MKIKQQKQIKKYLVDEFGIEEGKNIFAKQSVILDVLVKSQIKLLLKHIVLYKYKKQIC